MLNQSKKERRPNNNVEEDVKNAIEMFLADPPDSEFQRGYLSGLLVLAEQVLGLRTDLPSFDEAKKLSSHSTRTS